LRAKNRYSRRLRNVICSHLREQRSRLIPNERGCMIMAMIEVAFPSEGLPGKILKWKVRTDTMVAMGRVLLLYQNATSSTEENAKEPEKKLRSTSFGRVKQVLVKEGDIIQPGYASC